MHIYNHYLDNCRALYIPVWLNVKVKCFLFVFLDDDDDEEDDEKASKAPQPLSSSALIKLAEGGEDVVEDLELSDDD